jgi:uncharacterized protein YqgV (UPF0045/DUF77 family)
MPATNFAKQWTDAKSSFETATNRKKPSEETISFFGKVFRKSSGVENSLKAFDSAMKKGDTKKAAETYQTAWELCGKYSTFLGKQGAQIEEDAIRDEYIKLVMVLSTIVAELPKKIKELQKEKGQVKVAVGPFFADMNGQLADFLKLCKKDKPAGTAEKAHKVAKKVEPVLKALKSYTAAAGKSDVAGAKQGLDDFASAGDTFEKYCARVSGIVSSDDTLKDYKKAVDDIGGLCKTIRTGRAETARVKLEQKLSEM